MLISAITGSSFTWLSTLGLSGGAGIVGGIVSIFTDTYAYLAAAFTGHLGIYGWVFVAGVVVMVCVWIYNAWDDFSKDRPITFVE